MPKFWDDTVWDELEFDDAGGPFPGKSPEKPFVRLTAEEYPILKLTVQDLIV